MASSPLINHLKSIAGDAGLISYKTFVKEVLFAPQIGYYTKEHNRVGRNAKTDFYTAESLGPVFEKLVFASIQNLLEGEGLKDFSFVEIGAEPNSGLFETSNHPFHSVKTIRPTQAVQIPQKSIVFANELLDAQPFHRLIYKNKQWNELGVRIHTNNTLTEELLVKLSPEVDAIKNELPKDLADGYHLDLPLEAENLLKTLAAQDWIGIVLLFDYGLSWEDLIYNHPQGTARAYYKHKQHNDLLANIGNQDITCHVCWDRLIKILKNHLFTNTTLQRQESFFVHNANSAIKEIIDKKPADKWSFDKQTLKELIHPAHMGHKFQVLWAKRQR